MGVQVLESILLVTGQKAGGKDEFCARAEKLGYTVARVSDVIRIEWTLLGVKNPSTKQLQDLGNDKKKESGNGGYWTGRICDRAAEDCVQRLCINGVRNPAEVLELVKRFGSRVALVGIIADDQIRLGRYLQRAQRGDKLTAADFWEMDARDRGFGEPEHGQQVDKTLAMVTEELLFDNSGKLEVYHSWSDAKILALMVQHSMVRV